MKGQDSKIRGHMMRGAQINDPIRRITRKRVMDCSVGIGCSEGWVQSSGRGGRKRSKCRCGKKTALLSKVPSYTTNLAMPKVATKSSHGGGARCCRDNRGEAGHYCLSRMAGRVPNYGDQLWFHPPWLFG